MHLLSERKAQGLNFFGNGEVTRPGYRNSGQLMQLSFLYIDNIGGLLYPRIGEYDYHGKG